MTHSCHQKPYKTKTVIKNGVGFGSCLAMVISYTAYQSIGWAIIHGIFSWFYVLYYWIKYAPSFF
ncbi:hypothetical protein [Peribacillus acanthi]|uniref:hypothetical protein n=1 Tax=Peribacillus acanthi TaxID=2171554 RepID=UPI000D3EA3D8|nr:hypothetical protein [Peribacillus acanthi]